MTTETKAQYEPYKTLSDGVELVSRLSDGELFVARHFYDDSIAEKDVLNELFARGAGQAVFNLLNHENLVSIDTAIIKKPLTGSGDASPTHMLVWDYCDAGSLEQLLQDPPVRPQSDDTGFLPESLVWHVGISMLRALQWLHEGVRETYETKSSFDPYKPEGWTLCKDSRHYSPREGLASYHAPSAHCGEHLFPAAKRHRDVWCLQARRSFPTATLSGTISDEDNSATHPAGGRRSRRFPSKGCGSRG